MSTNRIAQCLERLREESRKAFIVYLGAGDPDLGLHRKGGARHC